jgi:hypothetical protein
LLALQANRVVTAWARHPKKTAENPAGVAGQVARSLTANPDTNSGILGCWRKLGLALPQRLSEALGVAIAR